MNSARPSPAAALAKLRRRYPPAREPGRPFDVLVATVLSARTRDEVTLPAARRLLRRYPTPPALAAARPSEIVQLIRAVGFYQQKARNLPRLARALVEGHGGEVPRDRGALEELPGVGPKTAACVLCYAFGQPVVAVDTHVHRVANRLGWVRTRTPEQSEAALTRRLPRRVRGDVNEILVRFGRDVCRPVGPRCDACPLAAACPSARTGKRRRTPASPRVEGPTALATIGRRRA